ncbi:MAG TPA: hypothetical protein P5513_06885 [Candidatus Diapherotrites archaeon]|nr:hypothetical protein [Candidatus Diapherotrites archaeon]
MKEGKIIDLLKEYYSHGMAGVARYLSDNNIKIYENSWVGKMKRLFESKNWMSMEAEIASLIYILNLTNENERGNIESDNSGE